MYEFKVPDYKKNNIINLMSSISNSFGKSHGYEILKSLDPKELEKSKNIVLLIIDGLGYNYLKQKKDSFLFKNINSNLTTTFLSTTACANTAFHVGYPPQQHGITGGSMNLKETGGINHILTFNPMSGGNPLSNNNFDMNKIINIGSYHQGFTGDCYTIIEKGKSKRDFIQHVAKETTIIPFDTYKNMFTKITKLIKTPSKNRKFIHAYMDEFDSIQHNCGVNSTDSNALFKHIDQKIETMVESLKGTDTKLIITSDHGFINLSEQSELWVEDFSGLKECLTIPITGESRVRDCFVRPGKVKDFEKIIATQMSKFCWCFKGEQLIKDNFYGLGCPNHKLFDRVGDYVLIMKENYILREKLANYQKPEIVEKASHGALTDDEMLVPLILVNC